MESQLSDVRRSTFDPNAVAGLRRRLESRLAAVTEEDRRFILEAVGVNVIAHSDGSWELEIQVPIDVTEQQMRIVKSRPGSNPVLNTERLCCSLPN